MGDLLKTTLNNVTNAEVTVCTGASVASTVLYVTICNEESADDGTFTMQVKDDRSGTGYLIYNDQSLPSLSTFEHSDKIVLLPNDTLVVSSSSGQDFDVIVSYLEQT